jgi:hypothetical protein
MKFDVRLSKMSRRRARLVSSSGAATMLRIEKQRRASEMESVASALVLRPVNE